MDLQKAYDQHDLLWGRLRWIGVRPRMLSAIHTLYAIGTLAMEMYLYRWHSWPTSCTNVQHMRVQTGQWGTLTRVAPHCLGFFWMGLMGCIILC